MRLTIACVPYICVYASLETDAGGLVWTQAGQPAYPIDPCMDG